METPASLNGPLARALLQVIGNPRSDEIMSVERLLPGTCDPRRALDARPFEKGGEGFRLLGS